MVLRGLRKTFGDTVAVDGFDLTVREDEYVTLLGPSGSGKSTLLRLVAGFEQPDAGRIVVDGEDIANLPPHRRGLGFVQQKFGLFPHMSVFDNVAFGLRYREVEPVTDESDVRERVNKMLDLVGLDGLGARKVVALSGGQRQRVSLARTLVCDPKICLLDEPLGALDANLRERMTVELRRIRSALGVTFMHVTGNEHEAMAMGDRMVVMHQGRAIQIGEANDIFHRPSTVQTARLLSCYNILPGQQKGPNFHTLGTAFKSPSDGMGAAHCAVRFDAITVGKEPPESRAERAIVTATFIASEFLGARVIFFFKTEDGTLLEAERHLSAVTPGEFSEGETCRLSWPVAEALFFDSDGTLLGHQATQEVA